MEVIVKRKTEASRQEPAVWDKSQLLHRLGDDEQLVVEMLEVFRDEMPRLIERLETNLKERRRDGLEQVAHAMKGACLNLGAMKLVRLCSSLEKGAAEEPWRKLKRRAEDVKIAYGEFALVAFPRGTEGKE